MFCILIMVLLTRLSFQNSLNLIPKAIEFYCVYDLYFNKAD